MKSSVLMHEMMMNTDTRFVSDSQMKRFQKMNDMAIMDKARNLKLMKLKEATQEIKDGVTYVEKVARKKKTDNDRAAFLVKQQKVGGHTELSVLSQNMVEKFSVPSEVMGKPQDRQG